MGTNYYKIPTESEMLERRARLEKRIAEMKMSPSDIESEFSTIQAGEWEYDSPWSEFIADVKVHLGKRSMGWKFCWNFHNNKFYSNKKELLEFIRNGRVVDEYGREEPVEEFIKMALEWGEPDGWIHGAAYEEEQRKRGAHVWGPKYWDRIVDGLRVSNSTEFS
jgi:hypothetical protein